MPIRAAINLLAENAVPVASSLFMGLVSGACFLVGTSPVGTVLDSTTEIHGTANSLFAVISFAVLCTWVVAALIIGIRRDVQSLSQHFKKQSELFAELDKRRQDTEREIAVIKAHIEDCGMRGRK